MLSATVDVLPWFTILRALRGAEMDRKAFLKNLVGFGALTAAALYRPGELFGSDRTVETTAASAAAFPHLVAVKGAAGSRGAGRARLFAAGIAALGGMGRFVSKGGIVVIKPNIGWDVTPDRAANTDPFLVKAIIEACLAAGAKRIYVFDHSCDSWKASYKNSGIEDAAKASGATVAPAGSESYYQKIDLKDAIALKTVKVHELILEADSIINVPVLKSHGGAGMTCALKNLMGTVWDRQAFHYQGLDRCIAESALAVRPSLTVVDASKVMLTGGPRGHGGSRYADLGMQILSPDIVAVDAAAAKTFGSSHEAFPYIGMAAALRLGTTDLDRLDIKRIALQA
jgi:uncharacterized protein (DUF362 family)